jgi:hypothetical protein
MPCRAAAKIMHDGGKRWRKHGRFAEEFDRLLQSDTDAENVIVQLRKVSDAVHALHALVNRPMPDAEALRALWPM